MIVGNKYDLFAQFEPEQKKIVGRYLRCVAHNFGAGLLYCQKDELPTSKCRSILAAVFFGSEISYSKIKTQTDYNLPLLVIAGSDCFDSI